MNSTSLAKSAVLRSKLRRADKLHNLAMTAAIGFLCVLAASQLLIPKTPSCKLYVTDSAGQSFAVAARTCGEAWQNVPDNWENVSVEP
jgi:hypothetical protein